CSGLKANGQVRFAYRAEPGCEGGAEGSGNEPVANSGGAGGQMFKTIIAHRRGPRLCPPCALLAISETWEWPASIPDRLGLGVSKRPFRSVVRSHPIAVRHRCRVS